MPVLRCGSRHRANGLGWLYVAQGDERGIYAGAPQLEHPDPHQSGQNPAFAEYCWQQLKYYAGNSYYRKQIDRRLEELDRSITSAVQDVRGAEMQLARLEAERSRIADLIP
jgi:hypothetical protein